MSCLEDRKKVPPSTPSSTPSRPRPSTRGTPSLALSTISTRTVKTSSDLISSHALATKTTSSSDSGTSRSQGLLVSRRSVLSDVSNSGPTHSPGRKEVASPSKITVLAKVSSRSSTQTGSFSSSSSSRVTSSPPRAPVIKRMSITGSPVPRQIVPASKTSPKSSWR
ncbi:hypothetical protein DFH11DRAFT_1605872 [Phellopilus nigrolimitatus]|nr:hypothetical protein DFH11DRAFT_1605872 [Phellopilus nigrolimitatus]